MRRALALVFAALALTACKVDTTVTVEVRADGSGVIAVTATADSEVVEQAPGLAEDLRFDDAIAAGWEVEGPDETDDGGLTVTITHDFASVEEATALLQSINGQGGPLHDVVLTRTVLDGNITTTLAGTLRVDGGIDAFADPELLAAIGGSPYADDIAETGLRPTDVVTFTFSADLPGEATTAATGALDDGEAPLTWSVPLDGTSADLTTTAMISEEAAEGGSDLWGTVATIALVALVIWVLLAAAFIAYVAKARKQRSLRRQGL